VHHIGHPDIKCSAMRGAKSLVPARPAMLRDVRPPDMGRNISPPNLFLVGRFSTRRLSELLDRAVNGPRGSRRLRIFDLDPRSRRTGAMRRIQFL
jgi:hypothetical protein